MAIQPIDLQALFTQVDKVGKAQSAQREGLAVQQALQGVQLQRKTEEHIQEVNEAQDSGDGAEKVNDRGQRQDSPAKGKGEKGEGPAKEGEEEAAQPSVIRDPRLGRNIDISL
ncbi:MAG: hypothetical protein LBS37_06820 [Treponema sp.]|jgi:hypothetical protein|nr:hypothetical protein [Treponema sp.]